MNTDLTMARLPSTSYRVVTGRESEEWWEHRGGYLQIVGGARAIAAAVSGAEMRMGRDCTANYVCSENACLRFSIGSTSAAGGEDDSVEP